ncbi:3-hydroxyisobutyryl-CoA hydrolase, mitochondrial [Porphyridium purpureum]|uniref:3-hydroxyisobutyryl-CoA hydrolase n=1 Tax=Porphyridium purpureum TaxID=35688 RepID=A0A5J4YYA5_PORPP|nr:3-hydroxyisobutyryl-CoA hydrolase, mitochondrial [Porphyridium purpureum]|eukprot:POR2254..scf208_2
MVWGLRQSAIRGWSLWQRKMATSFMPSSELLPVLQGKAPEILSAAVCGDGLSADPASPVLVFPAKPPDARKAKTCVIALNRPKQLNALTADMCTTMRSIVKDRIVPYASTTDKDVFDCAVLVGSGDKSFCAGGDVKHVCIEAFVNGRPKAATGFFEAEYAMNFDLSALPAGKTIVSLLDGIVMGGGAGISMHGKFRVATERSMFAMPECGIGFMPDVGATFVLPRIPHRFGYYLGLSGERIDGSAMLSCGVATHFVESRRLGDLCEALLSLPSDSGETEGVSEALIEETLSSFEPSTAKEIRKHANAPENSEQGCAHLRGRAWIPTVFAPEHRNMASIFAALERAAESSESAQATLNKMRNLNSPRSMQITLEALARGASMPNLQSCLAMETLLAQRACQPDSFDFYEGVRAALIDKDKSPQWRPELSERALHDLFMPIMPTSHL